MNHFKNLLKELKEKGKEEKLSRNIRIAKEQAIFKDLLETEKECQNCPRTENLTLDHIVPEEILRNFGVDVEREIIEGNYQLLCRTCNSFKGNRLDFSNSSTKEIIIKLLETL